MKHYIICIFVTVITILSIVIYINHYNNKFVVEEEIFNKKISDNTKFIDYNKNLPLMYKYISVASKYNECEQKNINPIITIPN